MLGIFIIGSGYIYQDTFLSYVFAEFVDINIWQLNWLFFCCFFISSGALGLFLGWSIWKNNPGSNRLWLLFITWQAASSIIPIGAYRIGEPDKYTIAITSSILLISWFTYRKQSIGTFSLISKKYMSELAVCFVVVSQLAGGIYINSLKDSHQFSHYLTENEMGKLVVDSLGKGVEEKMLSDTYGKHYKKYMEFYDQYEKKDSVLLKKTGAYLLKNGYEKDKFILTTLGTEQYSAGNLSGAISYLNRALEGGYCSELAKPSTEGMIHFENAQIYSMLSIIYTKQKDSGNSQKAYAKSKELFSKVKQEPPTQNLLDRWVNTSVMELNHFKNDLQVAPSSN